MQIFNFNGAQVRTIEKSGEPWFVLNDVVQVLGLSNARMVKERLSEDVSSTYPLLTAGGMQATTIINEDGLYDVILESRKPEAKAFRKWVTGEVLPAIRKTGGYRLPTADPVQPVDLKDIDQVIKMVQLLRIGLKDGLLDQQSGQALRRQIAERVYPQSDTKILVSEDSYSEMSKTSEYTGRWYLTKEIAVIAGVTTNLIAQLATKHNLRTDLYSQERRASPERGTGLLQIAYNEDGKNRLVQYVNQWIADGGVLRGKPEALRKKRRSRRC